MPAGVASLCLARIISISNENANEKYVTLRGWSGSMATGFSHQSVPESWLNPDLLSLSSSVGSRETDRDHEKTEQRILSRYFENSI
jgi:hypothetical protein